MRQRNMRCPRCGAERIATKDAANGADRVRAGTGTRRYCQNCGHSCDNVVEAPAAAPRVNLALASAIVVTVITIAR